MSDLISRQAAINALDEVSEHYTDKGREWHPHVNFMVEAIQDLPSAEPERKKGKWTVTPLFIKCSECNEAFMLIPQNYCPNCGALMREDGGEG